jgi:DNA-binding NarL/FixJ family response regulator
VGIGTGNPDFREKNFLVRHWSDSMIASTTLKGETMDKTSSAAKADSDVDILVIEDHALFRQGLTMLLLDMFPRARVVEAASADEALRAVKADVNFQMVLLDLKLPDADGLETLGKLGELLQGIPIAVVSASEDMKDITQSFKAGAKGYIVKSSTAEVLRHAISLVLSGETYIPSHVMGALTSQKPPAPSEEPPADAPSLTPRQREILILMAQGLQNKDIAASLGTLEGTVKVHVKGILQKLGVNNRTHAVVKGVRVGLVPQHIIMRDNGAD